MDDDISYKVRFAGDKWDLDVDVCPCDVYFNEWVAANKIANQTIYHFGTGNHHIVGFTQAQNGSGNRVFAITAAPEEYATYITEASDNPLVAKNYLCYFGNVYRTNDHLLPQFDVANLFHLSEFYWPERATPEHGGIDDVQLLDMITRHTRPGGHILFYTKSKDWELAEPIIAAWEKTGVAQRQPDFRLLRVYRKRA